ncbi:MAG: sugar phosphate nucleotidyltransferase [Acutalibacteraceae bacterium]|nr:sugar phosphate nucleotidyltransferase [Acutalibacteraceae bacterium]
MANKCAVILAGGEGKRMKSDKPKTLSEVMDKPMLQWVIDALRKSGVDNICVVKGYKKECIEEYIATLDYTVSSVYQAERLGTGHAVMMAKSFLLENNGDVIILNGDAPFMDSKTISDAYSQHIATNSSATVISARVENPTGYGRIVRAEDGSLKSIVEQKDADEETLAINEVNSGGFWFNTADLLSVLDNIQANNAAKEYYLPDALKLLLANGKTVGAFTAESADTVLGANDPAQLADLNTIAQNKYGKYPY